LWNISLNEKEPKERGSLINALTASKETSILTK